MSLSSLLIFAAALFVAAGSPGPSIAALVARVIAKGWRDVLPFLAAMWIGEAIWLSLAVFGLAFVAQTFHFAFVMLKWAGVAYLVFLAWKMWTAPVAVREIRNLIDATVISTPLASESMEQAVARVSR